MILHARHLPCSTNPEAPHLIILHGLLGSSDNWQTLGKRYAESHHVWMLDARNHGRSPHDPIHSYDAMAQDVVDFLDAQGLEKVRLLGHSMGGKLSCSFHNATLNESKNSSWRTLPLEHTRHTMARFSKRSWPRHRTRQNPGRTSKRPWPAP